MDFSLDLSLVLVDSVLWRWNEVIHREIVGWCAHQIGGCARQNRSSTCGGKGSVEDEAEQEEGV